MIAFHRFLIGTAVVFCWGLGIWMIATYQAAGSTGLVVLGGVFVGLGVALAVYLKNLDRFLGE